MYLDAGQGPPPSETDDVPGASVPSIALARSIRERLEVGDVKVADLHLWELAPGRKGCIVSLVTDAPQDTAVYKSLLDGIDGLAHLTVEVQRCPDHEPATA